MADNQVKIPPRKVVRHYMNLADRVESVEHDEPVKRLAMQGAVSTMLSVAAGLVTYLGKSFTGSESMLPGKTEALVAVGTAALTMLAQQAGHQKNVSHLDENRSVMRQIQEKYGAESLTIGIAREAHKQAQRAEMIAHMSI